MLKSLISNTGNSGIKYMKNVDGITLFFSDSEKEVYIRDLGEEDCFILWREFSGEIAQVIQSSDELFSISPQFSALIIKNIDIVRPGKYKLWSTYNFFCIKRKNLRQKILCHLEQLQTTT